MDLVGGYYDAGDNVKFGFPMAFTTTMLSWSVIEFGGLMMGELANAKEAIRWGTDYLLKATAHPDTIYVQVSVVSLLFVFLSSGFKEMLLNENGFSRNPPICLNMNWRRWFFVFSNLVFIILLSK